MTSENSEVGISNHAAERIAQRSGLGPSTVQSMLDNGQFFWACEPLDDKPRYAVLYDACSSTYLVAVLGMGSRRVVTLLTLDQFEERAGPVAPVRLSLARLALVKPDRKPEMLLELPEAFTPANWRVVLTTTDGQEHVVGDFVHTAICSRFLYVQPPRTRQEFERRARRVAMTFKFGTWFLSAVPANIDPGSVAAVFAVALDAETGAQLWRKNVSAPLQTGLNNSPTSEGQQRLEQKARISQRKAATERRERRELRKSIRDRNRSTEVNLQS